MFAVTKTLGTGLLKLSRFELVPLMVKGAAPLARNVLASRTLLRVNSCKRSCRPSPSASTNNHFTAGYPAPILGIDCTLFQTELWPWQLLIHVSHASRFPLSKTRTRSVQP